MPAEAHSVTDPVELGHARNVVKRLDQDEVIRAPTTGRTKLAAEQTRISLRAPMSEEPP